MTDDVVTVGYVHGQEGAFSWFGSMLRLIEYDSANNSRVMRGGYIAVRCGTNRLVESRNQLVRIFLERDAEWLFAIDTDMGFAPDTIDRLLAVADPVDRPIVGALCFANREVHQDGMGGYRTSVEPTVLDWVEHEGRHGFAVRWDYPRETVTRVAGTGMACIIIHRSALEKIGAKYGTWFDQAVEPDSGERLGEDLSFCLRAGAIDIPIYVHTGVRTTHAKTVWVSEWDYQRGSDGQGHQHVDRDQQGQLYRDRGADQDV